MFTRLVTKQWTDGRTDEQSGSKHHVSVRQKYKHASNGAG